MKILGIDPGFERLGIAILEKQKSGKEVVVYSECFHTSPKLPFHERLLLIGKKIREVIDEYKPEALAIEKLFLSTNQKTAMNVAEVRGVILYEGVNSGIDIHEYAPGEIKTAITGYGKADKGMVMSMVPKLCIMEKPTSSDDELDAVAIVLTAFAMNRFS